jgi:hypothetical protein
MASSMTKNPADEHDTITRLVKLYESLTDVGKDEYLATLMEDEDLMGRLLEILLAGTEGTEAIPEGSSSFVDFLRRVKG